MSGSVYLIIIIKKKNSFNLFKSNLLYGQFITVGAPVQLLINANS